MQWLLGVPFGRAFVRYGDTVTCPVHTTCRNHCPRKQTCPVILGCKLIATNCRLDDMTLGFDDDIQLGSYGGTELKPEEGI
eukprot:9273873-Ditylum_brightwellii.AAC.1